MTEPVIIALIGTIPSIFTLIGVIWIGMMSAKTREIVLKTELNTNSMKDALVASTAVASHAEGKEEGRVEGEAKAEALAAERNYS
jgi:hypothetical protein